MFSGLEAMAKSLRRHLHYHTLYPFEMLILLLISCMVERKELLLHKLISNVQFM